MKININRFVLSIFLVSLSFVGFNTQVVFASDPVASLSTINAGTETFSDFSDAGIIGAVSGNKFTYDTLIALVKTNKGSNLTLPEAQTEVNAVNGGTAWITGTAGGTARISANSVVYNGQIYIWGGAHGGIGEYNLLDIYDIASDSWSTGTAGGTARESGTAVLYNGKIYFWGGQNGSTVLNTIDIYDIASDSWSTGTAGGTARNYSSSVIYNGKIYIWGGLDNTGVTTLNTIDIYDIASDSWSTGTAGGTARVAHTSVLYNGKIYSWGGGINNSALYNTIDIYDIASDSWSTGTAGGTARVYHTSVLSNGKIYSFGGMYSSNSNARNTIDIYDIANDSWTIGTAGGTPRFSSISDFYNGNMYIWGGGVGGSVLNSIDIYNINLDTALSVGLISKNISSFSFSTPSVIGVIDNTAHTITLTVPHGTDITSLTPSIEITGASISPDAGISNNFTTPVIYTVTAKDSSTQTYTVSVVVAPDTTPPTIIGTPTDITQEATSATGTIVIYTNPTATDIVDGSVPVTCLPLSSSVFVMGTSTVLCTATDTAGNSATSTFNVKIQDTTIPVITLVGNPVINLTVGQTYTEQGATSTDNVDGDITSKIITFGTVNTNTVGTYTINYSISDSSSNTATTSRIINVGAIVSTPAPTSVSHGGGGHGFVPPVVTTTTTTPIITKISEEKERVVTKEVSETKKIETKTENVAEKKSSQIETLSDSVIKKDDTPTSTNKLTANALGAISDTGNRSWIPISLVAVIILVGGGFALLRKRKI